MKLPKISVVIPSYNKVKYIQETLDSIFDQKYENLEVIIQDGGSTDGTLKIIKDYLYEHPNIIKLESKRDNGQLDAINKGLKKSTGDIITFINADDVYEKDSFKLVANNYIENTDILWFVGKGRVINEMGNEIGTRRLQVRYMMPDQALSGAREMYQNSVKREVNIRLVDRGHAFHGFGGDMNDNASYVASISPKSGIDFCRFLQKEDQQKVYKQLLTDVAELLGVR